MTKPAADLDAVARGMFRRALAHSAAQLGLRNTSKAIERLRRGNCQDCETVRYNLARQVADYLSELDADLRGLYLYDPDYACGDYEHPCKGLSPAAGVNLIAWTRTKKSIPPEIVQGLGVAFRDARTQVLCPEATGYCFSLNLAIVSDAEVRERKGYAALIDSTTVRPTQIWSKYRVAG
jgi:hypothetical protein